MVLFGMLGSLTFAAKYAMAVLPNIEPVSLCVMLYAAVFGKKAVWPIGIYVAMEFLFYGLGLWNLNYLYIWGILGLGAYLFREMQEPLGWAILSGTFGLLFGALCGIVDVFVGGLGYAVSKWISGIPFDLLHCGGNFAMALLLFAPLRRLLERLYRESPRK